MLIFGLKCEETFHNYPKISFHYSKNIDVKDVQSSLISKTLFSVKVKLISTCQEIIYLTI